MQSVPWRNLSPLFPPLPNPPLFSPFSPRWYYLSFHNSILHLQDHNFFFFFLFQNLNFISYITGSGSQLMLYDLESGKMLRSFHVFDGIRVHGITCLFIDCTEGTVSSKLGFQLAVFGERRVKLFGLVIELFLGTQNQSGVSVNLNLLHLLPKFGNWVLDVCFMKV